jgi:DNA-binding MarR family transcriptional regulator
MPCPDPESIRDGISGEFHQLIIKKTFLSKEYPMKIRNEEMCAMDDMNTIYNVMLGDGRLQGKTDLRISHIKALSAFETAHALPRKELAKILNATPSRMTMIIKQLIEGGLAEAGHNGNGHKDSMIRLTPEGEKVKSEFLSHRRKMAAFIIDKLNKKDRQALVSSLNTACSILEK